jgi:glycosyltransferase involved in cell wall biosynthesis
MAVPSTLRIGVVATRLGGTDGVSLEADAWSRTLQGFGHVIHAFAGHTEAPVERCRVVPLAFFGHPDVAAINASVYGTAHAETEQVRSARDRLEALAHELRYELECWAGELDLDLLIAENTLSLPVHLPLGLAIGRLARRSGMPVLAHHHDLPWERSRFTPNAVEDVLDEAFPPRLPNIHHVCINSRQRGELERRVGRVARVIPNVIEMDEPVGWADQAGRLRRALGLSDDDLLVLQPTRVVPRKGIEHAIELVRRLERPAVLMVTGASGDEGDEYRAHLDELARLLDVRVVWASDLVAARRERQDPGSRAYSLDDAFQAADLVAYPSLLEGFGRGFLAAVRHRRPIVINRYPVYDADIRPLGFEAVELDGFVSEATVAQVRTVLDDPDLRGQWADHNEALVRRHFSTDVLRKELRSVLEEILSQTAVDATT